MALSSHLTFFSWVLISDIKTCWTLRKQEFSFNKKNFVIYNLHNISFVVLYILFTIKNFLWYIYLVDCFC